MAKCRPFYPQPVLYQFYNCKGPQGVSEILKLIGPLSVCLEYDHVYSCLVDPKDRRGDRFDPP